MSDHDAYRAIVLAVNRGTLVEPFTKEDFERACKGFAAGTYRNFLRKHRRGNGETSELFEPVPPNSFRLVRPLLYGL